MHVCVGAYILFLACKHYTHADALISFHFFFYFVSFVSFFILVSRTDPVHEAGSFIPLLIFIFRPYILCVHFSRTSFWFNSRKITTISFCSHCKMAWKEIGRKFLLIFHLSFFFLVYYFVYICLLHVCLLLCVRMHGCSIDCFLWEKKLTIPKHWLLHIRNNNAPTKAWPIVEEVVMILCRFEKQRNADERKTRSRISNCFYLFGCRRKEKCSCVRNKHNEVKANRYNKFHMEIEI